MRIAIASGKGGTGKTFIAASLAKVLSAQRKVSLVDADVEEPNAVLFVNPKTAGEPNTKRWAIRTKGISVPVPRIDIDKCKACGKCADVCNFSALSIIADRLVFYKHLCHSCRACFSVCPEHALKPGTRRIGSINRFEFPPLTLTEGRLDVGEAKAAPLIEQTIREAEEDGIQLIDCPPGVSCSMVAAVKNTDYVILVTENTPFGLHDLEAAVEVMYAFELPFSVIINKWQAGYSAPGKFLEKEGIPLLLKIPFSASLASLYSRSLLLDSFNEGLAMKLFSAGMAIIHEHAPETKNESIHQPGLHQIKDEK